MLAFDLMEGSILLWHDIAPAGRDTFMAWHGREHMASRADLPGCISARRYAALDPSKGYMCWYELAERTVLDSPQHRRVVDQSGTAKEHDIEQHFVGIARSVSDVAWSTGRGIGGLAAVYRYRIEADERGAHREHVRAALEPLVRGGGLQRVSLHAVSSHVDILHGGAERGPDNVLIVEGAVDTAALHSLCADHIDRTLLRHDGVALLSGSIYRLQALLLPTSKLANNVA